MAGCDVILPLYITTMQRIFTQKINCVSHQQCTQRTLPLFYTPTHPHSYTSHHPTANRFYWSINLGALISYTLVAYICQYGAGPDLGGEEWGFFVGYTIPSIMMCKYH